MNQISTDIDEHAARELLLYIENDEPMYTRYLVPTYRNYEKKYRVGRFDRDLAIGGMARNVCTVAARQYHAEHGTPGDRWSSVFPVAVRMAVGAELVAYFLDEMAARNSYIGGEQ